MPDLDQTFVALTGQGAVVMTNADTGAPLITEINRVVATE